MQKKLFGLLLKYELSQEGCIEKINFPEKQKFLDFDFINYINLKKAKKTLDKPNRW